MFLVRRLLPLAPALALSVAPCALFAQRPPRQLPPPAAQPALSALPQSPQNLPAPLPAPARTAAVNPQDMVRVQFPNAQVTDILSFYQDLTGKHVVADANVNGPINIMINDPVPRSEAIKIIETQLNLNGFPIVPAGNIIKIIGTGKNVRSAGVPLVSDVSQIPDSEQTVSFLLRLRYLDAQELATQLAQYIVQGNNNGFVALPKSGAVIITETSSSVRRLISLITQLDVPAAPVTEEFIRLERADATKAVEFLNGVFETKNNGAGTGGAPGGAVAPGSAATGRRAIRRIGEDGQPVAEPLIPAILPGSPGLLSLNGDSIIQGRITLTADVRTNRIHLVTNPVNIPLVEKLVADYDANTPFASPVRRNLRFVNARDVLPILIQALSEPGQDNNGNGASTGASSQSTQNRTNQNSSNNNSSSLFGNNSSSGSGGSFGGSSGSGFGGGGDELNTASVDTTPTEATVGTTKIIADPRINTIILLGSAEAKDKVNKVLDQLDVRAPQVVIRVVIGELSLSNNKEFGANYLLNRSRGSLASNFTTSTTFPGTAATPAPSPAVTPTDTSTISALTTLASGLPSGFSGGIAGIISVTKGFDIILSALNATNRFKTVNRPVIFTSNNKKATIISGQQIAVPTSSLSAAGTTTNTASIASNVEFKTVALELDVVPLINSDREVTLDIVQKLNSIVAGSSVTVGGTQVPTIAEREIKSTISMPNGATAVLGGLITMADDKTNGEIPYLGRLPLIGPLFSTRSRNISRSELVILLHPEVTNTPAELVAQRQEEERHQYLEGNLDEQLTPIVPRAKPVPKARPVLPKATPYPK